MRVVTYLYIFWEKRGKGGGGGLIVQSPVLERADNII